MNGNEIRERIGRWQEASYTARQIEQELAGELGNGIRVSGFVLLWHLRGGAEFTMVDLRRRLGYSKAALTEAIDRLEEKGYVARRSPGHGEDGRTRFVRITREGHDLVAEALA